MKGGEFIPKENKITMIKTTDNESYPSHDDARFSDV